MAKKKEVVVGKTLREEKKEEEAKKPVPMTDEEKIALEREIRRYVRRAGGYRKGLSQEKRELCGKLLAKRQGPHHAKVEIDPEILVPGLDNPTVSNLV